ncbi:MAG: glutamate--tRNA ligase [Elusimicrobia bacterium]|jgi:nondiscriminating glutamyl-tRNA synthetase|nr:glutamate--tRNA ligase [Elusimicrobiota bacterium]MBK7208332.1 glutamate--tRNA ligase [Elusimicrobiota bacterium]MBK7545093.1 glutamate--tRNA ligase [Elusimicrobiota bacterium]MBK7574612.1 glutamate--tRNA ligase [Elusimicrobiota bacterium]MBK7688020.1 glutamate--tRNA ligase [Elusimicrobiota bacterium]
MTVRVRFAPSPTGFLHIGGARTALFNWLHARHTGGAFLLRIEDTDEVRSTQSSVEAIFNGLKWLGLDWDEGPLSASDPAAAKGAHGPYFQMQRLTHYKRAADELVAAGKAFLCFATPEEVEKQKERNQLLKRPPKFVSPYRDQTPAQREALLKEGKPFTVRFKTPQEGWVHFEDIIRGPMKWENNLIEDFVMVKTSGVPTYNFACVVDDHLMDITHVIRGDDHLSNTPRQVLCDEALGWKPPVFAHLSMILGSDGQRLSKRHGATAVEEYRDAGYLPEATRNYLALLGWSTEDSQDLFTQDELVQKFTVERCGKSPAIFDPNKLIWMNGEYIRKMPVRELVERAMPFIQKAGFMNGQEESRRGEIEAAVALEHEKVKLLTDVPRLIDFFFKSNVEYDPVSVEKVLKKPDVSEVLKGAIETYASLQDFTALSTEEGAKALALRRGIKNAAVFHPVRVSVSGRTQGPSLFHMLEVLGRDRSLERMKSTLDKLNAGAL